MPHQAFHMDADEAERLQNRRSNVAAVRLLTTHSVSMLPSDDEDDSRRYVPDNTHTPHFCYMKLIGYIKDFSRYPLDQVAFDSVDSELLLADVFLLVEAYELVNNRKNYLVFEDNFQSSIASMVEGTGRQNSYKRLKKVCAKFESSTGMSQHEATSNLSYTHFSGKGLNPDDAKACAFVLSFYSGSNVYQTVNRSASIIARRGNGEATALMHNEKFNDASIIMFYLIKALAHIDFYWGIVSRAVNLDAEELEDYRPGNLVTWIQFSSSRTGEKPPAHFASRNAIFIIYSLTGRCIEKFSNFPEEQEVLFPPHSTFLVSRIVKSSSQTHIYMRQIELGLCKYSVMWVDDYIFFDWWENKEYMEKAGTVGTNDNVHFIPKASTESALVFLRSEFGQRLKDKESFRIVTDMTRDKENSPEDAGARLIKAIREMGFNNHCLVFTMNETGAWDKVKTLVRPSHMHNISVTSALPILENFINFRSWTELETKDKIDYVWIFMYMGNLFISTQQNSNPSIFLIRDTYQFRLPCQRIFNKL